MNVTGRGAARRLGPGVPAWLLAVFLTASLAGCLSDAGDEAPIVITDPDDFSQFQNGTNPAERPHIHDYWGGQERLQVMDVDERAYRLLQSSGGYEVHRFTPDAGFIIPLGTQSVEVTVSWQENHRLGSEPLELWIKTAADETSEPFTQLENGGTVVFESTNEQNDIPHQRLSGWRFDVAMPAMDIAGEEWNSHDVDVQIKVEAVRGLEIPPYPGHVDLWGNQTQIALLEARQTYRLWTYEGAGVQAPLGEYRPHDEVIVPFDADHVEVVLTNPHTTPDGLVLIYHGADTWDWSDAEVVAEEGDTRTYHVPVDGNGDSPYALQSLWRFAFRIEGESNPAATSSGEFYMEAVVHKEPSA